MNPPAGEKEAAIEPTAGEEVLFVLSPECTFHNTRAALKRPWIPVSRWAEDWSFQQSLVRLSRGRGF